MDTTAFWMRAARLSGRLDLSAFVLASRDPAGLADDPAGLVRGGVRLDHAARLCSDHWVPPGRPFLTLVDERYPRALANLPFAPPVLFWEGNLAILDRPCVAVVGTRRCSPSGRRHAQRLARALHRAGATTVSGGAWGIDSEAHLSAPSSTVAVLGQGLAARRTTRLGRLCDSILGAGGLVLSEFPPHTHAAAWTFPQRNRVVAGLTLGTVVIEASLRSGARITARHALEYGREVWALPGDPNDDHRAGCLLMIQEGARVYLGPEGVLEELEPLPAPHRSRESSPLLAALVDAPDLETLAQRTGRPLTALLRELGKLELAGHVERTAGDRYRPSEAS